jgi:hypothetical protein
MSPDEEVPEAKPEGPAPPRVDLFGDPVPDGFGLRGRPQHIATSENRNKVLLLLALGWNNERIARALYITKPTLRKFYKAELRRREEQRDRMDAALAMRLWRLVEDGSVPAMKEFRELVRRNDLMTYGQSERPQPAPAKPQSKGKKEQALEDAQRPDTGTPLGELMAQRQGQPVN